MRQTSDVDERVVLGIGAMLNLTGAQTLARDSRVRAQLRPESGSGFAAARAAHHRAVFPHCQRGTRGARQLPGRIRDRPEHRIEAMVSSRDQVFQRRQQRGVLVEISGDVARAVVRGFRQRFAAAFCGAKRVGLRNDHSSLSTGKLPDPNTAECKWLGRFRRSMSQLPAPVKESDALEMRR